MALPQEEVGYLAIVLHAHLPYVRHEEKDCLEERWLYEALTETYIPLLQTFEKLVEDKVDFRITFSLSPTLLSMLEDRFLLERYRHHLDQLIELSKKEIARTRRDAANNRLAIMYFKTFLGIKEYMEQHDYLVVPRFKQLSEKGLLELMTTAATHGFMPAMETAESIYAQWEIGLATFERYLGFRPKGVWVPECGYTPGLDRILKQLGVDYFFCDSHSLEHASPKPKNGVFSPIKTGYGVYAFARDQESSSQVWSSFTGYPGDYDYREYYRDIGFDLPLSYILPYIHAKGIRVNTGLKYYRITGKSDQKELYQPKWADQKAAIHAGNFMYNRENQIRHQSSTLGIKPLVVAPYDAELFGHWWYEGPQFLNYLCRKICFDQKTFLMITPSEYIALYPEQEVAQPPLSTWGRNGYCEVWVGPNNAWIYRHLHKAEKKMVELVSRITQPNEWEEKALVIALKQLLLAQSSDWPFMMDNQTMTEYAVRRVNEHLGLFNQIYEGLLGHNLDLDWLQQLELRWPIFDGIRSSVYLPEEMHRVAIASSRECTDQPVHRRILMLAWEYPPKIVGGLARAVYDLSRELVNQGEEVHVFTSYVEHSPRYENMEGVHVHRISSFHEGGQENFMDWVFELNLSMVAHLEYCHRQGLAFDVVHAHDWLVSAAAREMKNRFGLPLMATIHATEFGRNQGIFTDLQKQIHGEEWKLTYEAETVIACSQYMAGEMIRLFDLPSEKVVVIPNGVDEKQLKIKNSSTFSRDRYAFPEEKIIFFVGRLVREKGAGLLIEAANDILNCCPEAKFVVAGKGPMKKDLEKLALDMGVAHKFLFTGFIDDEERNYLFSQSYLAVFPSIYEPFGIVALEAMAAGTPVIVSDTGGMDEIVQHQVTGLKVYAGMVSSLRDQLIYALNNKDRLQELATEAKSIIDKRYSWRDLAISTRSVYDSLNLEKTVFRT
ncbi:MAG TPA: 1,4-alpha-glucan branching protein domain-containing protein [Bacillota bacterium]|nr:1,4-alpha-glucan branching protein domain-containing protein [Bacillota bacterium]